jgi:hypothetical protein
MLFMKGSKMFPMCGFSNTAVQVLRASDAEFETFDVLSGTLSELTCVFVVAVGHKNFISEVVPRLQGGGQAGLVKQKNILLGTNTRHLKILCVLMLCYRPRSP